MSNASRILVLAGLLLFACAALAQQGGLVGKQAPELNAKEWINAEEGLTLKKLKGQIVFIEFTATW